MSQSDGAQHICQKVPATLCSYPNYCHRNGCLNTKDMPKKEKEPRRA